MQDVQPHIWLGFKEGLREGFLEDVDVGLPVTGLSVGDLVGTAVVGLLLGDGVGWHCRLR